MIRREHRYNEIYIYVLQMVVGMLADSVFLFLCSFIVRLTTSFLSPFNIGSPSSIDTFPLPPLFRTLIIHGSNTQPSLYFYFTILCSSITRFFALWLYRYLGFFGTLFLPIDIAEAYFSQYINMTNVTEISYTVLPTPSYFFPTITPEAFPNATTAAVASLSPSSSVSVTSLPSYTQDNYGNSTSSFTTTSTITSTPSSSVTYTYSSSPSSLPTIIINSTRTATNTFTSSVTPTSTGTRTPVSATSTRSVTPSVSKAPSASNTRTRTPIPSRSPTASVTPRLRPSASNSPAPEGGGDCESGCGGRILEDENSNPILSLWNYVSYSSRTLFDWWPFGDGGSGTNGGTTNTSVSTGNSSSETYIPPSYNNISNNTGTNATVTDWEIIINTVQLRNGPLEQLWVSVYWVTFLLTYVIIPVTQEYIAAGEFTKKGRLCASVKINIIFYALCGVIAFGALAYVVIGLDQGLWDLLPVLISLANTFGLSIIILLLGYGTAEVPRAIWKNSNPEGLLRRFYFKAPELDGQVFDVRNLLKDTLTHISEFEQKFNAMKADKSFNDDVKNAALVKELDRCLHIVNRKVVIANELIAKNGAKANTNKNRKTIIPEEEEEEENSGSGFFGSISKAFSSNSKYKGITVSKLAKLHKKLMLHISKLRKTQFRFDSLVIQCIQLEYIVAKTVPPVPEKKKTAEGETYYVTTRGAGLDAPNGTLHTDKQKVIQNNFQGKDMKPTHGIPQSDNEHDVLSEPAARALMSMMCFPRLCGGVLNRFVWNFRMYAVPYVYKIFALIAEIMSILLLWSEATIFLNLTGTASENLSVFGWVLKWADELGSHSYVAIQLAAFIPLAYMCLASTYAVFRLKLFDMMDLSGNQNTDPYSLLVCASLFNRLQFSLAFNFLNVLMHSRDKADYPNTAFLNSVGARMDLSIVDWYLPIVMVVIYLACKLNFFDRCMRKIGIEESGDPVRGNRDHDNIIRDGVLVVKKGRRTLGLGGGDADDEEAREKQDAIARDRLKAVMARAQARREGRNPDEVAKLDNELANGIGSIEEGEIELIKSGNYASGGSVMSSNAGMMSLDSFSGAGSVNPNGTPAKGGLAALAHRAGMGKIGAAFNQFGAAMNQFGDNMLGLDSNGTGAVVDHGDDDTEGSNSNNHNTNSNQRSAYSDFSRHDIATADLMRARELSNVVIQAPPTLAELLKGKRKI